VVTGVAIGRGLDVLLHQALQLHALPDAVQVVQLQEWVTPAGIPRINVVVVTHSTTSWHSALLVLRNVKKSKRWHQHEVKVTYVQNIFRIREK